MFHSPISGLPPIPARMVFERGYVSVCVNGNALLQQDFSDAVTVAKKLLTFSFRICASSSGEKSF